MVVLRYSIGKVPEPSVKLLKPTCEALRRKVETCFGSETSKEYYNCTKENVLLQDPFAACFFRTYSPSQPQATKQSIQGTLQRTALETKTPDSRYLTS